MILRFSKLLRITLKVILYDQQLKLFDINYLDLVANTTNRFL